MGPPSPDPCLVDRVSADRAGQALAVIDPKIMLKPADNPFRAPIVADRGAFGLDGLPEDLPYPVMQSSSLVPV